MDVSTGPVSCSNVIAFTNAKILDTSGVKVIRQSESDATATVCHQACTHCNILHQWSLTPVELVPPSPPSEGDTTRSPIPGVAISVDDPNGVSTSMALPSNPIVWLKEVIGRPRESLDGIPICPVRPTVEEIQSTLTDIRSSVTDLTFAEHLISLAPEVEFEDDNKYKWKFRPTHPSQTTLSRCRSCDPFHEYGLTCQTGTLVSFNANPKEAHRKSRKGDLWSFTPQEAGSPSTVLGFLPAQMRGTSMDPLTIQQTYIRRDPKFGDPRACDTASIRSGLLAENFLAGVGRKAVVARMPAA